MLHNLPPGSAGAGGAPQLTLQLHELFAGEDIAWEVADSAREVILSAKTWMKAEFGAQRLAFGPRGNMFRRGWVEQLCADGSVLLEDGTVVEDVDVVMFCTGNRSF